MQAAPPAHRRLYEALAGDIYRIHPNGFCQLIEDDAAIALRDAHVRLCARTGRYLPPSGLCAEWLDQALTAARLQREQGRKVA